MQTLSSPSRWIVFSRVESTQLTRSTANPPGYTIPSSIPKFLLRPLKQHFYNSRLPGQLEKRRKQHEERVRRTSTHLLI